MTFKTIRAALALLCLVAALLTPTALQANGRASFVIVERPEALVIYNRYQQLLSENEKRALVPFLPINILDERTILSDGFTPCLKGDRKGDVVFLLRDESGSLAGERAAGRITYFRNATETHDTVECLAGAITLLDPAKSRRTRLASGTLARRIFVAQGLSYVEILGSREEYGWIDFRSLAKGRDWKSIEGTGVPRSEQLRKVIPPIKTKLNEVNEKLAELFKRLGSAASRPPRWNAEEGPAQIMCTLESELPVEQFARSSQLLAKNLETILLGTDLVVSSSPGRIEIGWTENR